MAVTPTQSDEIQAVAGFRVREQIETTKWEIRLIRNRKWRGWKR
jgi:hypothetical protein